jgi:hypothetical protein
LLRIRLLDNEPIQWKVKGTANGQDLFPISYRFGWIATPIKKFPENPYSEKNLHFMPPENYVDFLLGQYKDTGEITLDRIKRLGVNTLYIHEKWNDIQNSPFLTRNTAEKIKKVVEAAHKRYKGFIVFCYEISSLCFWCKLVKKLCKG